MSIFPHQGRNVDGWYLDSFSASAEDFPKFNFKKEGLWKSKSMDSEYKLKAMVTPHYFGFLGMT
jgi:hypothetical protein